MLAKTLMIGFAKFQLDPTSSLCAINSGRNAIEIP